MILFGINLSTTDIWLLGICGALIMALVGYRFMLNIQRHNTFNTAASIFRSNVLTELIGFYPIDQHWKKDEFHRLYDSIPRINSAVAEFRHHVDRKADFDRAVKAYNQYCREMTVQKAFVLKYFDSGESAEEKFKHIVEHLLSFAIVK